MQGCLVLREFLPLSPSISTLSLSSFFVPNSNISISIPSIVQFHTWHLCNQTSIPVILIRFKNPITESAAESKTTTIPSPPFHGDPTRSNESTPPSSPKLSATSSDGIPRRREQNLAQASKFATPPIESWPPRRGEELGGAGRF